jgi:hypothetical protein
MVRIVQEHFDHSTRTFYINESEDVSPLLDSLQEERNHIPKHAYKRNAARWRKIGEIPNIITEKLLREGFNVLGVPPEEVVKKLEREYPYLLSVDKI